MVATSIDNGGCGTVFKITPSGTFTSLHSFVHSEGDFPVGPLVQGSDGNLYGATSSGGIAYGAVFKITPDGTLTTLHLFDFTDGQEPNGALVQATDGNFYGTMGFGGSTCSLGCGTVFKMTPDGTLSTLHSFDGADGWLPLGGLLQATDGNFYGTTTYGGSGNCTNNGYAACGTVFKLSVGLGQFVETSPTSGSSGAPVTILGTNLAGATSVTFNGIPATINSNTGSEITTAVPTGATTGTVQVTTPGGVLTSNTDFQVIGPIQFVPVTPCRLVDTRQTGGPIQGGTSRNFTIPQLGNCGIPTSAASYSLNATVVPHGVLGYLTIWPEGEIQPYVSTMNSYDGSTKANAAIVPAGTSGAVSVYVSNTTDVVLDIDGYFAPATSGSLQFYPLTPCRVVDTRDSSKPQGLGPPFLPAETPRELPILSSPCFQGLPTQPQAYSFNVTVAPNPAGQPLYFLAVWPDGTLPVVSTLNNPTATAVANAAIVAADPTNGDIYVYGSNSTDVVMDVNGYFAAPEQGGLSLYPVVPCRLYDSRKVGNGQPFSGERTVNVVGSSCAPPSGSQAYVFNATVVPSGALGFLTLWPDCQGSGCPGRPVVSTLNAYDGAVTSNMAIVPNVNGSTDAYVSNPTQLILDISSYFAP